MKRQADYWLRGTDDKDDSIILFRIDSYPLTGMASSGQVVMLRSDDMTVQAEWMVVNSTEFLRKRSYTITALRTLWEDLVKTGYWTPTTQPVFFWGLFDPFRDMEP